MATIQDKLNEITGGSNYVEGSLSELQHDNAFAIFIWNEKFPNSAGAKTKKQAFTYTWDTEKSLLEQTYDETHDLIKATEIIEERVPTGGHYQGQSFHHDVAASTGWSTLDISFPHPISLLSASWFNNELNYGDEMKFAVAPDTVIGALTSGVSVDDTVLNVSSTVTDNAFVGYYITIDSEEFGPVTEIDADSGTITVANAAESTHNPGAYVKMTVMMVPYIKILPGGIVTLGSTKIGGSYIPANTTLRLFYNNIDGTEKDFDFILEYLY